MDFGARTPIAVAVFESNPVLSDALCALLSSGTEIFASRGVLDDQGCFSTVDGAEPEVILVDPAAVGVAPAQIRRVGGRASLVAYLAGSDLESDRVSARSCIQAGFNGLLTKTLPGDAIAAAIGMVARGGIYIDAAFTDVVFPSGTPSRDKPATAKLSEREIFVLQSVARGLSMKEIAAILDLSDKTIETYKARGAAKLNLYGRRAIVEYAIQNGWVHAQH